jgi:hypothetical protein
MAVNNYGTNLRVETNVQGNLVDNDEYVATKAAYEHNLQAQPSENAWAANHKDRLQNLYQPESSFEADPTVLAANKQDLKIRNLNK